jgi:hypothetical protein
MSEAIKNKLYNFEQVPPEGSWTKIAEELDQLAELKNISTRLYEHSENAPASAWAKIAAALQATESLQPLADKLYNAEVVPPNGTWNKIAAALDAPVYEQKPNRIYQFTRYAAAAVLIGLVGLAVYLFSINNSSKNIAAGEKVKPAENSMLPLEIIKKESPDVNIAKAEEARNDSALEASKKTFARLDRKKRIPPVQSVEYTAYNNADDAGIYDYDNGYEPAITVNNTGDRYIILMTPEGNFIRMSKKLSDLVCCVSGEEQDRDCREQVEKWRKQLACSFAAHPGNFGDILSLVSVLQEN